MTDLGAVAAGDDGGWPAAAEPPAHTLVVESFEQFYLRERRAVAGLAFVLSGSRTAAEDLAQDAFAAAYRSWARIGGYDDPGAWVRRVVANRSVSRYRRRVTEAKTLLRLRALPDTSAVVPQEDEELWSVVRQLPRRQAQAIALRYVDQCEVPEIAAILGCSASTVKTHLERGRAALARHLGLELP